MQLPTFSFMDFIESSTNDEITQSPEHLQILNRKFCITFIPFSELIKTFRSNRPREEKKNYWRRVYKSI